MYVDNFKLAGPKNSIQEGWRRLREGLHIEPEQRIDARRAVYLGCRHIVTALKLASGGVVTTMTYNMEDFLRSCIDRYQKVVGNTSTLRNSFTLFMTQDHRNAPAGQPGNGPVKECP
ncbi:MAG: hypothetical protein ACKPKO_02880, partial [Candidatus Fonsibacter sp.]